MSAVTPASTKTTLRLVGAGVGTIFAGHLGAALGGWLGGFFAEHAGRVIEESLKSGSEALQEFGVHYCYDRFTELSDHPPLEAVMRLALCLALQDISKQADALAYPDWFRNWETQLSSSAKIELPGLAARLKAAD